MFQKSLNYFSYINWVYLCRQTTVIIDPWLLLVFSLVGVIRVSQRIFALSFSVVHLLMRPEFVKIQGNAMPILSVILSFTFFINLFPSFILWTAFPPFSYYLDKFVIVFANSSYFSELVRTNELCRQYSEACIELCKEMNLKVVDLWTALQKREDWLTACFT